MFIKSGRNISELRVDKTAIAGIFSGQAEKEPPTAAKGAVRRRLSGRGPGGLLEYLASRRSYMLAVAAVYMLGAAVGVFLASNMERSEVINLCAVVDSYFTGLPGIDMTARIFGNIVVNLVFIFGAYLCGVTIFAPLVCSAFGLYKGLSAGFILGVYFIGGGTGFHMAAGLLNLALSLFVMVFFVLVCAEAMSFASFLFKNEESFKSSMSFKNISVYSSRFMLLTLLIALATLVQTVAVPLVYAWLL